MAVPNEILKEALNLGPLQQAELIGMLLSSLDKPDKERDALWSKELESRTMLASKAGRRLLPWRKSLKSIDRMRHENPAFGVC